MTWWRADLGDENGTLARAEEEGHIPCDGQLFADIHVRYKWVDFKNVLVDVADKPQGLRSKKSASN